MQTAQTPEPTPGRRPPWRRGLVLVIAACLVPHVPRLLRPSLYSDDVVRVSIVRNLPLDRALFVPFNEHVAPLFELVSRAAWASAGGRLSGTPLAFTLASILPFPLALAALGRLVARGTGSPAAGLAAVALAGLSPLFVETVDWYSASSFTWALAATLVAFDAAGRGGIPGRLASALAALSAPAFSGIGLLAGPLGALRALADPDGPRPLRRRLLDASAPLAGAAAYLIPYLWTFGGSLSSGQPRTSRWLGLLATIRAPIDVLLPGLIGVRLDGRGLPPALECALFALALAAALAWAWRDRAGRPFILGGLFLILGGYALAYGPRALEGSAGPLRVQRYHLFPQFGLILLLAPALARLLRPLEPRPLRAQAALALLTALLLVRSAPPIVALGRFYRFADQHRTLAAFDRLEAICRREGIPRDQLLAALEPTRPRWFEHTTFDPLMLLAPTTEARRLPDHLVRACLLSSLTRPEREAIWGSMDASPYLTPPQSPGDPPIAIGRLVGSCRAGSAPTPGRFTSSGWPSYLDFEFPPISPEARALGLPASPTSGSADLEIWWAGPGESWSETRLVRWRTDPSRPSERWAVPLDRLPHFDPSRTRRLRVAVRGRVPVELEAPRLLR